MKVYPLVFEPIFKPKVWGGRRLETLLNKRLPPEAPIGESWELSDLPGEQSIVANGPDKGRPLPQLVADWGSELYGRASLPEGRFPLLLKFLDARETLSVQVHPDEAAARRSGGRVRVKHEAWYVVDASEGAFIYRGLRPGVTRDALRQALADRRLDEVLERVPVRRGHCHYLPSGTVHALGAGVLVAEVQTPSDVTYRLFDWDRIDPSTGALRELHVDEAMQCIRFDSVEAQSRPRQHVASVWTAVSSLVRCDSFTLERVRMVAGVENQIPYEEMVIWMVLEGRGSILYDGPGGEVAFGVGDTVLLPAALAEGRVRVADNTMWLEITLPIAGTAPPLDPAQREALRSRSPMPTPPVPLTIRQER